MSAYSAGCAVCTSFGKKPFSVLFSKHFVKEGLIDAEYGRFFARLENMREKSDYTCLFETTEDEVMPMIPKAKELVAIIEGLV